MKPPRDEPFDDIGEDELVAHLFGDADDPEAVEAALAGSPQLRRRRDELRRTLELMDREPIPPRSDDYGAEVWRSIEGRLDAACEPASVMGFPAWLQRRPQRRQSAWLGLAAAAALLLALGFLLGRLGAPTPDVELAGHQDAAEDPLPVLSDDARRRLLQATLAKHLGRSERLLTEVANATTARRDLSDAELERLWAAELLASNRLYRRAAEDAGRKRIARLLAELEPVLLELAHAGDDEELGQLRRRVDEGGLLFKVRVTGRRLEPPERLSSPPVDSL